jgi:hypothetical protein
MEQYKVKKIKSSLRLLERARAENVFEYPYSDVADKISAIITTLENLLYYIENEA